MSDFHLLTLVLLLIGPALPGQVPEEDWTREACIDYALAHQPDLLAAREGLELTRLDNQIALSDWYPEVLISGNLQHYFQRPVSIFPDFENPESGATTEVEVGTINSSNLSLQARQTIYNPTVAAALRRQDPLVAAARLDIEAVEIDLRESVSRAWYAAVRERERQQLLQSDLDRQERALRDARLLYEEGINDKVDYKRATITRNRTALDLQNALIGYQSRVAELKAAMGYPASRELDPAYDIDRITLETFVDSFPVLRPTDRVELRQLDLQDRLLGLELLFYRQSWLPDFYLGGTYNMTWQDNSLTDLYNRVFPNSLASLNVSVPLFSGGRRGRQVQRQRVLQDQLAYDVAAVRDRIDREYRVAVNTFEQARNAYEVARENWDLAEEIYEVVDLQYREGITPFLSVIIAENDLQAARLAIVNSLIDAALARVGVRFAAGTL
ncbi:TolC family protein [Lewinella sp. IMCC34183]|uniref:TolC family protein n=1 Tax=Lewinella sp. IMCC34183 TaxID=2248762 RepID=UPI000E288778|nr:TolC family protein [Lewinella sp. IMCC34183]